MPVLEMHGTAKLRKALLQASGILREEVGRALEAGAREAERNAKRNLTGGNPLHVRTGALRTSIRSEVDRARQEARIGTDLVYGPVHEYGATIRPREMRKLAIPVGGVRTWPRRFAGPLFFRMTRGGLKFLVDAAGKMMYVLKPQVTVPARPWLGPALTASKAKFADLMQRALQRAFDKATR